MCSRMVAGGRRRRGRQRDKRLFASFSSEKEDSSSHSRAPLSCPRWTNPPTRSLFLAEVTPHRSLSARGLRLIIGFVCAVSLCTTTLFWHLGAWPIAGFNGAEILLALFLLRAHHKSAREREVLLLSEAGFKVQRFDSRGGASELVLPAGWLNVILTERPGRVPGLYLAARGQQIEVACRFGRAGKTRSSRGAGGRVAPVQAPGVRQSTVEGCPGIIARGVSPCQAATSPGPIDLIRSKTRLRTAGSVNPVIGAHQFQGLALRQRIVGHAAELRTARRSLRCCWCPGRCPLNRACRRRRS